MNKTIIVILIISLFFGFTTEPNTESTEQKLTILFGENLNSLVSEISDFQNTYKTKNTEKIRSHYLRCREKYKQCEFLIEYYDGDIITRNINSAPLLKLNPSSAQTEIIEPEGFQVLDELLYSSEILSDSTIEKVIKKTNTLTRIIKEFSYYARGIKVEKRHLIEAIQLGLIRISSLGVTGFDVPASGVSIQEVKYTLQSFSNYVRIMKAMDLSQDKLLRNTTNLLSKATEYCTKNNDFDSFDRLDFLRKHIEPLYGYLNEFHQVFSIEYYDETTRKPNALNFRSKNIFSADLFNPNYFTRQQPSTNNMYKQELGKLLFYDPILSKNNDRACASCHNPNKAFTDGLETAFAFDKINKLERNTPTLINAIFAERFFYDLRAGSFEDQVQHVVTNEKEFHNSFSTIIDNLKSSTEYRQLFLKAFPEVKEDQISPYTISSALGAYQMTLHSFNSPIDRFIRGENVSVSKSVRNGFNLFMGKAACGTCHFAPTFSGLVPPRFTESESEVLGITERGDSISPKLDKDLGRYAGRAKDQVSIFKRSFKTMTVRNIALTAPYFHNGAFSTLEQVIDFYNNGGGAGLGLNVQHQTLPADKLNLTAEEKRDIISFLKTLTDTTSLTSIPKRLPVIPLISDKQRTIGGEY